MFKLDERLEKDTFEVCQTLDCKILVMNNITSPWFIVVPFTDKIEWYELDDSVQYNINALINKLSVFLKDEYKVDKLNIATLGNVVKQMHIHVIGRFTTDPAWPNPVWGNIQVQAYSEEQKASLKERIKKHFS
ncbi:HIT family protein [Allofrancisella guangzhouensis]|uniref:HIT domain protein n=1 Tax=Allofrancisella guangzhouensis TaxID=594679 RepID=A0A0A8E4R5_9GAMM|nr:HIT family protein [Allofrancisella guangzhouensis]AJC48959.1 HIT domain protein [Allofrancisella guangzhouensis]MBK2027075.1 HIT family protein [Allofrancisella guangzhouensis]MBK2044202.1 HIT family protein [Allofrancisella guangzhouensis]MBK2045687.1 HIT family protein [Allofrancisella guangzhouensis]